MSEKQRNLYIHNSPASLPARGLTSLPAFTPSTVDRLGGDIADCVWDNNTSEKTFFFLYVCAVVCHGYLGIGTA